MFGVDDAALALIAAGVIGTAGQLYTNRQNLKYQSKVNDVNWQIAAMNNATQVDMANTAHQREVADLRKAGLNPILSAGGSGASTPNLTSVRGDAAQIENPVNALASSASGLARFFGDQYRTQLDQAKADVKSTDLSNSILETQAKRDKVSFENEFMLESAKKDALESLFGTSYKYYPKDDQLAMIVSDTDQYQKGLDLIREGIESDLKNSANSNLRNWIQSISGGINSAGSLLRFGGKRK